MGRKALHVLYDEVAEEERRRSLAFKYLAVFGSGDGLVVLADILKDLGVMQDLDPRDASVNTLRNYAETTLLYKVGYDAYVGALKKLLEPA